MLLDFIIPLPVRERIPEIAPNVQGGIHTGTTLSDVLVPTQALPQCAKPALLENSALVALPTASEFVRCAQASKTLDTIIKGAEGTLQEVPATPS